MRQLLRMASPPPVGPATGTHSPRASCTTPATEREQDVLDDMRETLRRLGVTEGIIQRTERALRNAWQGPCYVRRSSLDTEDEIKRRLAAGVSR